MKEEFVFWIALALIMEPLMVTLWPRVRAVFMLSVPIKPCQILRVENYYMKLAYSHRFGILMPLRKRIRRVMVTFGIVLLILVEANNLYNLF